MCTYFVCKSVPLIVTATCFTAINTLNNCLSFYVRTTFEPAQVSNKTGENWIISPTLVRLL